MKFLLPGLFLLMLGAGNVTVGEFKEGQYEQVLQELSVPDVPAPAINASPLRRIQLEREASRLYQRQKDAEARRDFYRLVSFGGEVFMSTSLVLFLLGGLVYVYQQRQNKKAAEPIF